MTYSDYVAKSQKLLLSYQFDPSIIYALIYKFNPRIDNLVELTNYLNDIIDSHLKMQIDNALDELIHKHKPLGYILGYVWFMGIKFEINNKVLIPRIETEYWTDKLIEILDEYPKLNILDLCCGSGVIGLSIKKQLSRMELTLSDISKEAITNTELNARLLNLNVNIVQSDLFSKFENKTFDVIVCNPPYIANHELLDASVLQYEPHLALFADDNGLHFYKQIITNIKKHLNQKYLLIFEIGYNQAKDVLVLIKEHLNIDGVIWKDQFNKDRTIFVKGN